MSGVRGEVGPLRRRRGPRRRDRSGAAGAKLRGPSRVDPLAVLEEVGVAVLVAGAGDERRPSCAKACGQSSGSVTPGRASASTMLYPEWQPRLKTMLFARSIGERRARCVDHLGAEVGGECAVGAEVAGQEHESWRSIRGTWSRRSCAFHAVRVARRTLLRRDRAWSTGRRPCLAARSVRRPCRPHRTGSRSPSRARVRRGHDPVGRHVRIEHPADFGRGLDEPADRQVGIGKVLVRRDDRRRRPRTRPGSGRSCCAGSPPRASRSSTGGT